MKGLHRNSRKNREENLQLISKLKRTISYNFPISTLEILRGDSCQGDKIQSSKNKPSFAYLDKQLHLATRLSMAGDIHQRISIDHPSRIYETF